MGSRDGAKTLLRDAQAGVGAVGASVGWQNAHEKNGDRFERNGTESRGLRQEETGGDREFEVIYCFISIGLELFVTFPYTRGHCCMPRVPFGGRLIVLPTCVLPLLSVTLRIANILVSAFLLTSRVVLPCRVRSTRLFAWQGFA